MGTKAQVLSSTETPEPHRASTSSSVKWVPCWPAHTQGHGEGGLKSDMEGSLSWDHSDTHPLAICIEGADSNEQGADPGLLQASQHCWGGPSSWPQSMTDGVRRGLPGAGPWCRSEGGAGEPWGGGLRRCGYYRTSSCVLPDEVLVPGPSMGVRAGDRDGIPPVGSRVPAVGGLASK